MDQAEACRKKAVECERAVLLATEPDRRRMYLDLARQWRAMAVQAEELDRRKRQLSSEALFDETGKRRALALITFALAAGRFSP